MKNKGKWTFEKFRAKLDKLDGPVRKKAVELASEYMRSGKFSEKEALKKGVLRAEEWFYDREG